MKKFISDHIEGLICLSVIMLGDIILNILMYVPNSGISITPFQNILVGLLALVFSVLLEILREIKESEKATQNVNDSLCEVEQLIRILPDSRIQQYKYVDDVVRDLQNRLKTEAPHSIDFVLLDTKRRTNTLSRAMEMSNFIKACCSDNKIKTRMLFNPKTTSLPSRYSSIINSFKQDTNGYYAYQESTFSFANFFIIDKNTVFIRNPYKNGTETSYCIIKNDSLSRVYLNWFEIMWSEASIVDRDSFDSFDSKYRSNIPQDKIKEIEALVSNYRK